MKLRLFTDPHIGLNRTSHTTPESRRKLRKAVYSTAMDLLDNRQQYAVCLGDLFDSFSVDGMALLQGYAVMKECVFTLYGNHDLVNRMDVASSAAVIGKFQTPTTAKYTRYDADVPRASYLDLHGCNLYWVDHKLNQEIFMKAVADADRCATKGSVLFLHCNYNSGHATKDSDLNLSREDAKRLLDKFSHIFIGHEHQQRLDHNGRVIVMGNTHPTSFADISDKFCYDLTINGGIIESVQSVKIWNKSEGYTQITWQELPSISSIPDAFQFIDVVGQAKPADMPAIAKAVADLWSLSEDLLCVRNSVQVISSELQYEQPQDDEIRVMSIPEQISEQLAGTPLDKVWQDYLQRI